MYRLRALIGGSLIILTSAVSVAATPQVVAEPEEQVKEEKKSKDREKPFREELNELAKLRADNPQEERELRQHYQNMSSRQKSLHFFLYLIEAKPIVTFAVLIVMIIGFVTLLLPFTLIWDLTRGKWGSTRWGISETDPMTFIFLFLCIWSAGITVSAIVEVHGENSAGKNVSYLPEQTISSSLHR